VMVAGTFQRREIGRRHRGLRNRVAARIELIEQRLLIKLRQDRDRPRRRPEVRTGYVAKAKARRPRGSVRQQTHGPRRAADSRERQMVVRVVIVVQSETEVMQVVFALRPPGRLAGLLHCREQERNQNRNDGDDDEEFDQREPRPLCPTLRAQRTWLHVLLLETACRIARRHAHCSRKKTEFSYSLSFFRRAANTCPTRTPFTLPPWFWNVKPRISP